MVLNIAENKDPDNYRSIKKSVFAFPSKGHPQERRTPREETRTHTTVKTYIC